MIPSGVGYIVEGGSELVWFWYNEGGTLSYSDRQRALQWVLPTTLRVYGLRPSGKTKGSTAS